MNRECRASPGRTKVLARQLHGCKQGGQRFGMKARSSLSAHKGRTEVVVMRGAWIQMQHCRLGERNR
jgi:hypothetical protein